MGAVGMAVPPTVVSNAPIAERLGVDDRWIVERTGISERRVLGAGETLTELATEAARRALAVGDLDPSQLDLVLAATASADHFMPNTAPLVAAALGADHAGAMDVGAACTGFLYAVATATAQIESGRARQVLVIGADRLSGWLDPDDRRTAALFGDGAGAVLMTATDGPSRVGPTVLRADGARAESIMAHRDDSILRMEGHDTFKHAVLRLTEVTVQATAAAGLGLEDVDLFVYHQANRRILRSVGQRLGLDPERVVDCVERYGNTSAASIPIALAEASADGRLREGARVLLAAFGSGFTWGGVMVEWGRHA
jgi:3-oxoacyl-[acyl-carrier-protein] synthase-3